MIKRFTVFGYRDGAYRTAADKSGDWVRYKDVEPLLKRLAELEAKEQKREKFDRESA